VFYLILKNGDEFHFVNFMMIVQAT